MFTLGLGCTLVRYSSHYDRDLREAVVLVAHHCGVKPSLSIRALYQKSEEFLEWPANGHEQIFRSGACQFSCSRGFTFHGAKRMWTI